MVERICWACGQGCTRPPSRGLCERCYKRFQTNGSPYRAYDCIDCGLTHFKDDGGRLPQRCPRCRRDHVNRLQSEARYRRKGGQVRGLTLMTCAYDGCANLLVKYARKHAFCSDSCHFRQYRADNPDVYTRSEWRRRGHTEVEYNRMLEEQNHRCAACGTSNPGGKHNRFVVDHDHRCCPGGSRRMRCGSCTRGLLCNNCNLALGYAGEDAERLRGMAEYVDKWNAERPLASQPFAA